MLLPPINIPFSTLNIDVLVPMLIAFGGALLILIVDFCTKQAKYDQFKSFYAVLCIIFLIADICFVAYSKDMALIVQYGFFDFVLFDGIALFAHVIIIIGSLLFVILSLTHKHFHEFIYAEFYALFLFVVGGLQIMISSENLILIFLGVETSSLAIYTLIAMHNRLRAIEAAIKYFSMGALSAGFFCFGAMLLYFSSGEFQLTQIAYRINSSHIISEVILLVGFLFIFAALGFKNSSVPFHTWTPDVYEGSSSLMAGFISIVPKIAAFVVALRFFGVFLDSSDGFVLYPWIQALMYIIVVASMTIPNLIALWQQDVKRMLAYSSISHAGLAFAAIMINTPQATQALFLYWSLFLFTNLGTFALLWVMREKVKKWDGDYDHPFSRFSGLVQVMPIEAVLMAIFMLSLAGVPPFAVFWGKMYLMSAALNQDFIILAIIIALNSAISAYYYLKLIVFMFLKEKSPLLTDGYLHAATLPIKSVLLFAALMVCSSIFYVENILEFIGSYI